MNKAHLKYYLLLLSVILISSCDTRMAYDSFEHVEDSMWKWDNPIEFTFSMEDTSSIYDILIRLRHTTEYPLSNLYMFVEVDGPSGQAMKDTINFILAENSGKWLGKGVGNIREIGYLFRKGTMFPETGDYKVSIEQAMRLPQIPVSEVGLRVERVNP